MQNRVRPARLEAFPKTIDGIAARLEQEAALDRAEALVKQAAAVLRDAGLSEHIDFPTFPRVAHIAHGYDVPPRANITLVRLDDFGVPRPVLIAAAVRANLSAAGATATTNMRIRLSETRKRIENSVASAEDELAVLKARLSLNEQIDERGIASLPAPELVVAEYERQLREELLDLGVDLVEFLSFVTAPAVGLQILR